MTVTLTQAKAHLRITHSEQDTYITDLVARAKAWTERYIGQLIATGTVIDTFTTFGDSLQLSRVPLTTLTSIGYIDTSNQAQSLTGARYQDGRIYAPTTGWPAIATYSTITVTYSAGYTPTTPLDLDIAMLLLLEYWFYPAEKYELDEYTGVPCSVTALAKPFRTPTLR